MQSGTYIHIHLYAGVYDIYNIYGILWRMIFEFTDDIYHIHGLMSA